MSWEIQKFLTESLIPFNSVIISFQEAAKEAALWIKLFQNLILTIQICSNGPRMTSEIHKFFTASLIPCNSLILSSQGASSLKKKLFQNLNPTIQTYFNGPKMTREINKFLTESLIPFNSLIFRLKELPRSQLLEEKKLFVSKVLNFLKFSPL